MKDQVITTKPNIILEPLTPTSDAEKGELYSEVINDAIHMHGVYNIALTGGYGSGKSSIIETFITKNKTKYRFLRVSLASFNFEKSDEEEKSQKTSRIFGKSNSESDEKIALEISILQQLLYQLDAKKDGYSFRARTDIRRKQIFPIIGFLLVGFTSAQILWNPCLLLKWFSPSFVDKISGSFWQSIFFLFFLSSVIYLLYMAIYTLKRLKVAKIDVKPLSVELEKRSEISTFNAFLDELLYAFKKIDLRNKKTNFWNKKDVKDGVVVIFEDIDRVKGHQIFQKIRELNNILRYNPDTEEKKVKFIYAVKESIFLEERDKNKFFDVIIPVLRYVNNQNSKEKLTNKFSEIAQDPTKEFNEVIQIASYCIDEMRTINNIFNEFQIYQSTLVDTDKLPYKVLALVIYKNLFPKDFELIHSGESALQKLFDQRKDFETSCQAKLREEIDQLEADIAELDSDHVRSKVQLRKEYILAACYYLKSQEYFSFADNQISIETLHEDANFGEILNGALQIRDRYGTNRKLSLSQLESKVNHPYSFHKRLELLDKKSGGAIEDLRFTIQKKEKQLNAIKRLPFGELNPIVKPESFLLNPDESNYDKFKLDFIQVCINKGYIGSDYKHYISVFHSNQNFSVQDRLFLMAVKANKEDQWDKVVEFPINVLNELSIGDWDSKALVNRSILEYLYNIEKINREGRVQLIKHVLVRKDKLEIINELFNEVIGRTSLLSEIMTEWQSFLNAAYTSTQGVLHFLDEVLINVDFKIVKNQDTEDAFAVYLSDQKTLLDRFPKRLNSQQLVNFKENMSYLWVTFHDLEVSENTNLQLLDAVFDADVFQLNLHMITLYLKHHEVEEYQFSYTGLKAVIPNSPILDRIDSGKDDFILIAMKEAIELGIDWSEDKTTFLEIINDTLVSEEAIEFLLANMSAILVDAEQVTRKDNLKKLIYRKLIVPSWKNIQAIHNSLLDENEELEILLNDSDWVSKIQEPEIWDETHDAIIYDLLGGDIDANNLSSLLENYPNPISLGKLFKSTRVTVVSMLIQDGHISFNRENFDKLEDEHDPTLALDFLIVNKEDFLKNLEDYDDLKVDDVLYILDGSANEPLNRSVLGLIKKDEIEKCSNQDLKLLSDAITRYKVLDNLEIIKAILAKLTWKDQINWFASIVELGVLETAKLIQLIEVFREPFNEFATPSVGKWISYNSETKLFNKILKDLGLVNNMSKEKSGKILIKRNSSN